MADFRRVVTALAVMALMMGFASTASAQPYACTAQAAETPLLRSEGVTELTGDILIRCTGVPTQLDEVATITVFTNATVTSRNGEPLLIINDVFPTPDNQDDDLVFRGLVQGNQMVFSNIPVLPPPTAGGFVQYRISNIRLNASEIGAVTGLPNAAVALISVIAPVAVPIATPQQTIGFVTPGLTFDVADQVDALLQCVAQPGVTVGNLVFAENFATAFKVRTEQDITDLQPGDPGARRLTESGLIAPELDGAFGTYTVGLATSGTRLRAVFTNLPGGITLTVPNQVVDAATTLQLVGTTGTGNTNLTISGQSATAIWEVVATDPDSRETIEVPVSVTATPNLAQNLPSPGVVAQVAGSYAPVLPSTSIPRFVNQLTTPENLFSFAVCRTILLFPFVSGAANFDTGLALSNTSLDGADLDTEAQNGTCTVNWFGPSAPPATVTGTVAAGTVETLLAPADFQGYAVAICNFQFAHGFAFVTDRVTAMGYLPLVIPNRTRTADAFSLGAASGDGEQLTN